MTKISDLNILASAKSNAFIPVVDPDEALPENQNKRIMLSTLATGGTDNTNFSAYDPNVYYSNAEPDFVSYNGNTYEYINATPAKGKTPATQPAYWKLASAGLFSHKQNTDTHTNSRIFEIGKRLGTVLDINGDPVEEPEGNTILVFAGPEDVKTAIRYVWETTEDIRIDKLQFTNNYAGGTIPVWVDFGASGSSDAATTDYTPEDSNNTTGFFAGLLTSGKLKVKAALDAIVTAIGTATLTTTAQTLRGAINELLLRINYSENDFGTIGSGGTNPTTLDGSKRLQRVTTTASAATAINISTLTNFRVGETITFTIDSKHTGDTLAGFMVASGATTVNLNGASATAIIVDQAGLGFVPGAKNRVHIRYVNSSTKTIEVTIIPLPIGSVTLDVPSAVQTNLANTANWTSGAYTGPAISGVAKGAIWANGTYLFSFYADNLPARTTLV